MQGVTICSVCGKPTKVCNSSHVKGGLTVTRLDRGEMDKDMRRILISKHRYMLTRDKTRAVIEGDPEGVSLLVGRGGEIDPTVAEAYGLETEDSMEVSKVTQTEDEAYHNLVTAGTGATSQKTYDRLAIQKAVEAKIASRAVEPPASGIASIQRAHLAQGLVNHELGQNEPYRDAPVRSPVFEPKEETKETGLQDASDLEPETLPVNKRSKTIGSAPQSKTEEISPEETAEGESTTGENPDLNPQPPHDAPPANDPMQDPEKPTELDPTV